MTQYDMFNNQVSVTTIGTNNIWNSPLTTTSTATGTGNIGQNGQTLTTSGWVNTNWGTATNWTPPTTVGDLTVNGTLVLNGTDLTGLLKKIEERLAILHPNKELESRWEQLKALGEQYRALEKDILEKEYIWETLKT